MGSILMFDTLIAAVLLVLYGTILVNWWRRPAEKFPALRFGSQPLKPRSVKRMWGVVLLLPIAFSALLAVTWVPVELSLESTSADSPRGTEILMEEAWSGGDGVQTEGMILQNELIVQDGTVTRSSGVRLPWFLLVVCAAYIVFVMRRTPSASGEKTDREPSPPAA